MGVFSLNVHAAYACRHSGACCTAGWNIPVEPELQPLLGSPLLIPDAHGRCQHFHGSTHLCDVHRDHGHDHLPASCRHFPRRALIDDRGTHVTLSHFCPTAARLLIEHDGPLEIVSNPSAFPAAREYDGMDARGQWAPVVRPGLLFDLKSYDVWEQFIVSTLASGQPIAHALGRLATAAENLRAWTPSDGAFGSWIGERLSVTASERFLARSLDRYASFTSMSAFDRVTESVPDRLVAPGRPHNVQTSLDRFVLPEWDRVAAPTGRYLAAKAFASWSAYDGFGVRTLIAELAVTHTVLLVEAARVSEHAGRPLDTSLLIEAIRASDWLLVHLVDRPMLMRWLTSVEDL